MNSRTAKTSFFKIIAAVIGRGETLLKCARKTRVLSTIISWELCPLAASFLSIPMLDRHDCVKRGKRTTVPNTRWLTPGGESQTVHVSPEREVNGIIIQVPHAEG